jgi:hypothetical protein
LTYKLISIKKADAIVGGLNPNGAHILSSPIFCINL